ncbi:MAG: KTSC domain-containing protein [Verrucomicrobiota bacterium]|jgi:hypothetical protein
MAEASVLDVEMMPVDATLFESIGYVEASRQLVIKFRHTPMLCFDKVPFFRFQGLLNAPRKDAYYQTFIKDQFPTKEATLLPSL